MLFRVLIVAGVTVSVVMTVSQHQAVAPPWHHHVGMKVCNPDGSEAGVITELAWKDNQSVYILDTRELTVENWKQGAPRRRLVPTAGAIVALGRCQT